MKTLPATVLNAAATAFLSRTGSPSTGTSSSGSMWGLNGGNSIHQHHHPHHEAAGLSIRPLPSPPHTHTHTRRMMVSEAVTEVTPELLAQLAGCAALIGTGKVLLTKEEEEGIEPLEPWAVDDGREKGVDLYRDTWVRYFGYFNEVGEAFRPVVPTVLVTLSYVVAFGYILADSYSQGAKVTDTESGQWKTSSVLATIDSLLFQIMASVIFPSFTINRWVTMMGALIAQLPPDHPDFFQYLPTATGLVIIPLICPPLDVLTHRLLDNSFRSVSENILAKER